MSTENWTLPKNPSLQLLETSFLTEPTYIVLQSRRIALVNNELEVTSTDGPAQPEDSKIGICSQTSTVCAKIVVMKTTTEERPLAHVEADALIVPVFEGKKEERFGAGDLFDNGEVTGTPLERVAQPEDVADAILYLAKTEFVTGQVITVDGGRSL